MQQVQPEAAAGDNPAAAIEIRLEEIERKLDELATAGRKSDTPPPPNKERSGFWSEILKALIPSLVLMWATYAIKDSVDMALQERQLQLQNVQAMTTLQNALQDPNIKPEDATRDAVELAGFGRYSIPFFVNVLEVGGQVAKDNSEQGIRMVSRSEPEEVCVAMARIIHNRSGLYIWTTHLKALKLLGETGCISDYAEVAAYAKDLSSLPLLQKWVAPAPVPDQSEYDRVAKQAGETKSILESATRPSLWHKILAGEKR